MLCWALCWVVRSDTMSHLRISDGRTSGRRNTFLSEVRPTVRFQAPRLGQGDPAASHTPSDPASDHVYAAMHGIVCSELSLCMLNGLGSALPRLKGGVQGSWFSSICFIPLMYMFLCLSHRWYLTSLCAHISQDVLVSHKTPTSAGLGKRR